MVRGGKFVIQVLTLLHVPKRIGVSQGHRKILHSTKISCLVTNCNVRVTCPWNLYPFRFIERKTQTTVPSRGYGRETKRREDT